jgi:hypothetical protein
MGFTLWGMVLDPTSPSLVFWVKYPLEIYYHVSLQSPIPIVLNNPTSPIYFTKLSWDSIWVVYGLNVKFNFFWTNY